MSTSRRRCPGNCGKAVRKNRFSCADCLTRLPDHLRRPIIATAGKPSSVGKSVAWANGNEFLGKRGI